MHRKLSGIGACSLLAALLCMIAAPRAVAGPAFYGGSATYADDVVTGLAPPSVLNERAGECADGATEEKEHVARIQLPNTGTDPILFGPQFARLRR